MLPSYCDENGQRIKSEKEAIQLNVKAHGNIWLPQYYINTHNATETMAVRRWVFHAGA